MLGFLNSPERVEIISAMIGVFGAVSSAIVGALGVGFVAWITYNQFKKIGYATIHESTDWRKNLMDIASKEEINVDDLYRIAASVNPFPKEDDSIDAIVSNAIEGMISNTGYRRVSEEDASKARIIAKSLLKENWIKNTKKGTKKEVEILKQNLKKKISDSGTITIQDTDEEISVRGLINFILILFASFIMLGMLIASINYFFLKSGHAITIALITLSYLASRVVSLTFYNAYLDSREEKRWYYYQKRCWWRQYPDIIFLIVSIIGFFYERKGNEEILTTGLSIVYAMMVVSTIASLIDINEEELTVKKELGKPLLKKRDFILRFFKKILIDKE